jgi:hypothetical protein
MKRFSTPLRAVSLLVVAVVACGALYAQANDMVVAKASEFVTLLQKGDFQAAYQKVDSNLGFKSNPDTFKKYWQALESKAGKFVEVKRSSVENKDGYFVVTQVAKFEKGHVDLKVALDNMMRVSGFQYANHKDDAAGSNPQAASQPAPAATPAS